MPGDQRPSMLPKGKTIKNIVLLLLFSLAYNFLFTGVLLNSEMFRNRITLRILGADQPIMIMILVRKF